MKKIGKIGTHKKTAGHFAAALTIIIWGTTFISTKILLADFQPAEILFIRFILGYLLLFIACPKRLRTENRRQERTLAAAGLCGICLYYLLENIALTLTTASNVGVIISAAPFFTAIIERVFHKSKEKLHAGFFAGFGAAMAGIALISFGTAKLTVSPAGDALALLAAFVWGCYSVLTKKIGSFGFPVMLTTRRTFLYGILFMTPALCFSEIRFDFARFADVKYLFNLLYLGAGASALCFVTWGFAVKQIGAVKGSIYIYLVPVITAAASVLFLNEQLTPAMGAGTVLTLAGLFLSEYKSERKSKNGAKQQMRYDH